MYSYMLAITHQFKIFYSVIQRVAISVVNYFAWQQRTTKMLFHYYPMNLFLFPVYLLNKIPIMQGWSRSNEQDKGITVAMPPIVMDTAPTATNSRFTTYCALTHCIIILSTLAACQGKPKPVLIGEATVQCTVDCVSVSKGFLKEHADLFDEVIRLRAEKKLCQEKQ